MKLQHLYDTIKNNSLSGRYITLSDLFPILEKLSATCAMTVEGHSVLGANLYSVRWGSGPNKILAWSQMHGNESTTTKALFDLFAFLDSPGNLKAAVDSFLEKNTLLVLPMLNPDGAETYTRENANQIDLNRDAKKRSQPESQVLRSVFERFKPDLCLNLHDQRTIYGLPGPKSATLSFLAPAANKKRSLTASRKQSMQYIATIAATLSEGLAGHIGRYDDTFNEYCVGDTFQRLGVPTILFEAGHYPNDYQREETRKYVFFAFLALFQISVTTNLDYRAYFDIPENNKMYRDVVLRNALVSNNERPISLAIQYKEELHQETLRWVPYLDALGPDLPLIGHKEIDIAGQQILINSHENVFVNEEIVTLTYKNGGSIEDFLSF
ncbi:M14 family zinc carboxypeptidase [Altibacter sp. HG106]|uniref:M14 family zinc carboxypeptidase n=1 Tax=Altibacter sp. HG106 TaxID=3023937 RepID=UPI002350D05C|nr:M14 family zinc carboxypeptidase [Altibacter sp. HG106]MDC7993621.1 M14 family zinc carboxypeptidase [Altibacter sp. HG106]